MASPSKTLSEIQNEILQCSICLGQLTEPKLLECVHRFCKACLDDCFKKKVVGSTFYCPICRFEMSVPKGGADSLKPDRLVTEILSKITLKKEIKESVQQEKCGSCLHKGNVHMFCVQCKAAICDRCQENHKTMRILQDHKVVPVDSVDNLDVLLVKDVPQCPHHDHQGLYIHCKTCNSEICSVCVPLDHPGHEICKTQIAAREVRQSFNRDLMNIIKVEDECSALHNEVEHFAEKRDGMISSIKENIQTKADKMKENIDKQRQLLFAQIDRHNEMYVTTQESLYESLQQTQSLITERKDTFTVLVDEGKTNDWTVLEAGREMHAKMKSFVTRMRQRLPDISWLSDQQCSYIQPDTLTPDLGTFNLPSEWRRDRSWVMDSFNRQRSEGWKITDLAVTPSGKLIVALSKEIQATYTAVSLTDGSEGWKKSFSMRGFPPNTPCFIEMLEEGNMVMGWHHIFTLFSRKNDTCKSFGTKMDNNSHIYCLTRDSQSGYIIASNSINNNFIFLDTQLETVKQLEVHHHCTSPLFVSRGKYDLLVCDGDGRAYEIDIITGNIKQSFLPPKGETKESFVAKSICHDGDERITILWRSEKSAVLVQYTPDGYPFNCIPVKREAYAMIVIPSGKNNTALIVASATGNFEVFKK